MKSEERILPFVFRSRPAPNRFDPLAEKPMVPRMDENLVDIFQRLRGIIYVLLSELCAKDSTTVEGITPSTLKISTESSVNSGARNQESGCKQKESFYPWSFGLDGKLYQLVTGFTRVSTNFYSAFSYSGYLEK